MPTRTSPTCRNAPSPITSKSAANASAAPPLMAKRSSATTTGLRHSNNARCAPRQIWPNRGSQSGAGSALNSLRSSPEQKRSLGPAQQHRMNLVVRVRSQDRFRQPLAQRSIDRIAPLRPIERDLPPTTIVGGLHLSHAPSLCVKRMVHVPTIRRTRSRLSLGATRPLGLRVGESARHSGSRRSHTWSVRACGPPPATRRCPMTCCTAELCRTIAPRAPTLTSREPRVHDREMPAPFPTQPPQQMGISSPNSRRLWRVRRARLLR